MEYEQITTDSQLLDFCDAIRTAQSIAFDTEFISEDSYRPDLCLLQVAADGRLAVIDTRAVDDVTPFWRLLADEGHETIVHAGREEIRFCRHFVGCFPHRLLDVQIAAGFIGLEYPASYGTLVSKLLDEKLEKGETRTNWRHRPLSSRQLQYALQDVVHLHQIRDTLYAKLDKLKRRDWLEAEMEDWQQRMEATESSERWRRVSGISNLSARSLAIVRQLWRWREEEAKRRDTPVKRVLRDDLIVELARRRSSEMNRIRAVRGLEHGRLRQHLASLAQCIELALAIPESELPRRTPRDTSPQINLLAQFLTTALGSICRSAQLAPGLVGTNQDVRNLIAYRLDINGARQSEPPALACGWRAEVVGQQIDDLLAGKLSIRIAAPLSDRPLRFEAASQE